MVRPRFSVIIPLYNAASTIDATIRSVIDQTLQDFEILIVDDRSTDGSYEIAESWSHRDNRVRVLRLPDNSGGPVRPRNEGIRRAEGSLLAFLDHDDRWLPTKLDKQLSKHEEDDFALTYTRCILEAPGDAAMDGSDYHEAWRLTPLEGTQLEALVRDSFVPICTVTLWRSWADRVGPFRGINGVDDWQYWMRVAAHGGRFGFVNEPLAVYRWVATNLSNQNPVSPYIRKTRTMRALAAEFPQYKALFASEERRFRQRAAESKLRWLSRRLRPLASRALLPPRLWSS